MPMLHFPAVHHVCFALENRALMRDSHFDSRSGNKGRPGSYVTAVPAEICRDAPDLFAGFHINKFD